MKQPILTLMLIMAFTAIRAQYPVMIKDISASGSSVVSVNPVVEWNGKIYFTALDGLVGHNFYSSNGTAANTQLVAPIVALGYSGNGEQFMPCNGKLCLGASDGITGTELWASDGTGANTNLVKDINPGALGSTPHNFVLYNNKLYFSAEDSASGTELWVTDGTSVGTQMVKDINTGTGHGFARKKIVFGGKLFFSAWDGIHQNMEIWFTDGTAGGTQLLRQINTGYVPGLGIELTEYNGKLYFAAKDSLYGMELWSTDGTTAGTTVVKDISAGSNGSWPTGMTIYNNKLYFSTTDSTQGKELWVTDGSASGTQLVKAVTASNLFVFDNLLYFSGDNNTSGVELWRSDGTPSGTQLAKDIWSGIGSSNPGNFVGYNGLLYYMATDSLNGGQLHSYNPITNKDTLIVPAVFRKDACRTSIVGYSALRGVLGSLVYGASYDTINNRELYIFTTNPLGSIQLDEIEKLVFYPNPFSSQLTFSLEDNEQTTVSLYNFLGQQVWQQSFTNTTTINTEQMQNGIYLYELKNSNGTLKTGKLVKQ